ncbi:replication initiator protein [Paraburkholderia unamae]|uniref:replication initiation protein n=1 Tax=Paraburkholderia unamae TaxID=219649 RepID=UPI000DC5C39C|nr:replication initiation protein [Paraburkholderia unamae]RAR47498.1 replication initiator protein [Paraburkholderia unamae]
MENPTLPATPHQLALDIYDDMSGKDVRIDQASRDIGYLRNNIFTRVGGLGIAARRVLDAAYFIVASKAPDELIDDKVYTFSEDINYFKWLMRYDSRNHSHLVTQMRAAAKARVEIMTAPSIEELTEKDSWGTISLLGDCYIERNVVCILLSGRVIRYLISPYKAHWLSLRDAAKFTLSLARAVYDRLIPCEGHGVTEWFAYEDVLEWPGKVGVSRRVFKEFRKHFLEPAVQQLNEESDFEVSWEANAARVSADKMKLRFRFTKKQGADAARAGIPDEMYLVLHNEFAFDELDFLRLANNRHTWTDERLVQAIEYTQTRLTQGKVTISPKGYLFKSLEGNYRIGGAEKKMLAVQSQQSQHLQEEARVRENAEAQRREAEKAQAEIAAAKVRSEADAGREFYEAADAHIRKELLHTFVTGLLHQRQMVRVGVSRESLTTENILTANRQLAETFCTHVCTRMKKVIDARAK